MALGRYVNCPYTYSIRTLGITRVFWTHANKNTGAMLEEPIKEGDSGPPKMKGSAMLIGAKTKEEVEERLKKDVYVEGGVWDLSKVQIIPFKSALRKAL